LPLAEVRSPLLPRDVRNARIVQPFLRRYVDDFFLAHGILLLLGHWIDDRLIIAMMSASTGRMYFSDAQFVAALLRGSRMMPYRILRKLLHADAAKPPAES